MKTTSQTGNPEKKEKSVLVKPFLLRSAKIRKAPVRFGYGLEVERFERFRFSVPVRFLCKKGFRVSVQFNVKERFFFRFRKKKRFRRLRFPVPVRFLSHIVKSAGPKHGSLSMGS